MNYLYDGSFEGFLTCVHEHFYSAAAGRIARFQENGTDDTESAFQEDMFSEVLNIKTDQQKADKVSDAIKCKMWSRESERIYTAFRSDLPDKEMSLLRYIILGFRRGSQIRLLHTHPDVMPVEQAERKLSCEVHRLCGLIRFSAIEKNILYSKISPDNEVLEFLAPHFIERFHSDPFIIHDEDRNKALFAYDRKWHLADFTAADAEHIKITHSEEEYRALWRRYFEIMPIKERINPKCQRGLMPARYWKNLTEMSIT